jgi:hypothetical protein
MADAIRSAAVSATLSFSNIGLRYPDNDLERGENATEPAPTSFMICV